MTKTKMMFDAGIDALSHARQASEDAFPDWEIVYKSASSAATKLGWVIQNGYWTSEVKASEVKGCYQRAIALRDKADLKLDS